MELKTFSYSDEALSRGHKASVLVMLFLPVFFFIFIFFLLILDEVDIYLSFWLAIIPAIFTMVIVAILFFTLLPTLLKKLQNTQIYLSEETIERRSGKSVDIVIRYSDINHISVRQNTTNDVAVIKLNSPTTRLYIREFEDMTDLLNQLSERIPDKSVISMKKTAIDWGKPYILMSVLIAMGLLIIFAIQSLGQNIIFFSIFFLGIAVGFFLLFNKPISKMQGTSFRKIEFFIGLSLCVTSGGLLIISLLQHLPSG